MSGDSVAFKHRTEPPPLRRDQTLFLDFDGTLVEIASAPSLVQVPATLPHLLCELADRLDGAVFVVSGRPLDQLARMLAPYAGAIAGDHGLERRYGDGNVTRCPAPPKLAEARSVLAEFAARHDGVRSAVAGGFFTQAPARDGAEFGVDGGELRLRGPR